MPVTWCKAMYLSAVMKVLSSRGSCTSRSHPHFSHASGIHWRGSEIVVMPASSQTAAADPFGRTGQILEHALHLAEEIFSCPAATSTMRSLRIIMKSGSVPSWYRSPGSTLSLPASLDQVDAEV